MYSQPQLKRNCVWGGGGGEVEEGEESISMNYYWKNKGIKLFLFDKNVLRVLYNLLSNVCFFTEWFNVYKAQESDFTQILYTFGF